MAIFNSKLLNCQRVSMVMYGQFTSSMSLFIVIYGHHREQNLALGLKIGLPICFVWVKQCHKPSPNYHK